MHSASIAVCGSYFCWSYPLEKQVHIIKMDQMNLTDVPEGIVLRGIKKLRRGFTKLSN